MSLIMSRKFATHKITMNLVAQYKGVSKSYFAIATIEAHCGLTTKSNEFSLGQDGILNVELFSWATAPNRAAFDVFGLNLDHYKPFFDWLNYVEKHRAVYGWVYEVKLTVAFVNNIYRRISNPNPDKLWIDITTVRVVEKFQKTQEQRHH